MVITLYKLEPPSKFRHDESIRWVCDRVTVLIDSAKLLRGPLDTQVSPVTSFSCYLFTLLVLQGKEKNFAHNALFAILAAAFYSSSQKLLRHTAEFQEYIPEEAIMLVAAGVSSI